MRPSTRVAAGAGTVALVTAGAVACGSHPGAGRAPEGSPAAAHAVQAAYVATTDAKTATFRVDAAIHAQSAGGSSQVATITGRGQADFATKAFTLTMNVPSGGVINTLLVHGTEYLQLPAAARSQIPGHKAWVSVNLTKVSKAKLGAPFSQVASASTGNPTQALSQLLAVSSGVTTAGHATVAGVPTTEYRAHVNLNKVAARVQAKEGPTAAQAIRQQIKALHTATVPVQVWIDAHHLVRQIRYQIPIPAASTGGPTGSGTAALTMTFTSFGTPVQLTPPPASQTTDITHRVLQHANASPG